MNGLCLAVAAVIRATLPTDDFTLAWTHSVEKVRWEEDYRVVGNTLMPVSARVHGSGAGMEPPPDAKLQGGVWHYRPAATAHARLRVTISPYAADYDLCWKAHCAPLAELVAMQGKTEVVEISGCEYRPGALHEEAQSIDLVNQKTGSPQPDHPGTRKSFDERGAAF